MKAILIGFFIMITSCCYGSSTDLELLISAETINTKIIEAANQINKEYADKNLTILMVMKGAVCVTSDLIRHINVPFKLEYIKAKSYGYNGTTSGTLTISDFQDLELEGRDVLIVDDIFETGKTMLGILEKLKEKNPASLKTFLLLVKDIPRKTTYVPDYTLFNIPNRFVIGYGLDYKELYRGLPEIYAFPNDIPPF